MKKHLTVNSLVITVTMILAVPMVSRASESPKFRERETTLCKDVFDQNIYYEGVNQLDLGRWGRKIFRKEIPAANVNVFDEVPDSSFFTNRHGRRRLSNEELAKGSAETAGPDLSAPMKITKGKQQGLHPGFFIEDAKGDRYCLKFDNEGSLELATAAEVAASRFYHAIGYHVPQYTVLRFKAEDITIGENAYTYDDTGFRKKMTPEILEQYLSFLPVTEDGEYLASASKIVPGKNVGHLSFRSRRQNDPEDPVNHRDRREIRALSVFSAWLNNNDIRESNTLEMAVTENGKTVLKRYLFDFNSAFGAAAGGAKPPMFGHEYAIDYGEITKAVFALGFWEKPWQEKWRRAREMPHKSPAIGYFSNDQFDPEDHKAQLPYEAFRVLTNADGFWAAKIIASFTDEDIRTMVKAGRYSRPEDEDYLVQTLAERRDLIAKYWFSKAAPLDAFEVLNGKLVFKDLAVRHGFVYGNTIRYVAEVSRPGKKKKIAALESREPSLVLDPSWTAEGGKAELRIRVVCGEEESPYVKVVLGGAGVEGVRHED